MTINTLAAATIFQQQLDKIAVQDAVTGWMDANAGQVKYNGGAEVKIPKMSVQGMGDYDRDNGYQQGSVTLEYETRKMTQDRGRKFQIDPMDVDESNFIPTAAAIMAEFQRTQVIPEIDAYRISKIASEVITANKAGMVEYNYTPGGTGTSALRKVKEGIKAVRSSYNGPLVIHATPDFLMELELELAGKSEILRFRRAASIPRFQESITFRLFQHLQTECTLPLLYTMEKPEVRKQADIQKDQRRKISISW